MQNFQRPLQVALPPRLPADVQAPAAGLVTCSICLRVRRAAGWVEAEEAIRELRTYELREPIHLRPGLCDDCIDAIEERRGHASDDELAAAA
jgi:hypothetical protein